jgi:DNA-binding NarL/FixJ family response regulator
LGVGPIKVFLIDDSARVIQRLEEMLAPLHGVDVVGFASNVSEALRNILASAPSIVILDLQMVGGNGIAVLQTIKQPNPTTILIILTNYATPQYQKKCVAAGAHAFLDKSKDFAQVPWVVQTLSGRHDLYLQQPRARNLRHRSRAVRASEATGELKQGS